MAAGLSAKTISAASLRSQKRSVSNLSHRARPVLAELVTEVDRVKKSSMFVTSNNNMNNQFWTPEIAIPQAFAAACGGSFRPRLFSTAPKSPSKEDKAQDTKSASQTTGDGTDPNQTMSERAQDFATNVRDNAQEMATNMKDSAQVAMDKASDKASDMRDEAQAAIDKVPVSKIKQLMRDYGPVAIGTYGGIYVGTLGLLYGLVELDVVGAGDAISMLKSTGLNNFVDMDRINPRAGNFALAWILTKFTEPIRLVVALSITPSVARTIGWAPKKTDTQSE